MVKSATTRLDELEDYRATSYDKTTAMESNHQKLSQSLKTTDTKYGTKMQDFQREKELMEVRLVKLEPLLKETSDLKM